MLSVPDFQPYVGIALFFVGPGCLLTLSSLSHFSTLLNSVGIRERNVTPPHKVTAQEDGSQGKKRLSLSSSAWTGALLQAAMWRNRRI